MSSLKQEKQERTGKKQERTNNEQGITDQNKKINEFITLYEAKRQVFALIQQGWTYRRISPVTFQIHDLGTKRFSVSEIHKIKNDFLGSHNENVNKSNNSKGSKAEIFRLIKNGTKLEDIVISMSLEPNVVKEAYNEYMDLKNLSPRIFDDIMEILNEKGIVVKNPASLIPIIGKLADSHMFLYTLEYPCCVCKKPVSLSPYRDNKDWVGDLASGLHYLSQNNCHPECL